MKSVCTLLLDYIAVLVFFDILSVILISKLFKICIFNLYMFLKKLKTKILKIL